MAVDAPLYSYWRLERQARLVGMEPWRVFVEKSIRQQLNKGETHLIDEGHWGHLIEGSYRVDRTFGEQGPGFEKNLGYAFAVVDCVD